MKKGILFGLMFMPFCIFANEKTFILDGEYLTENELKTSLCQSNIYTTKFPNAIMLDNTEVELYCTFTDNEKALQELNIKEEDTISFIADTYNLEEKITKENINVYKEIILSIYENDDLKITDDLAFSISKIESFFDIYENEEINLNITNLISEYKNSLSKDKSEILTTLNSIVPTYSRQLKTSNDFVNQTGTRVGASLNVSLASSYANKYATSPNTASYYYFSHGDCTNFMSQILEYSGVSQVMYDSVHSGWWHKYSSGSHTHSRSWTMADTFSRYMGVTVSTTNILTWSKDLKEGDFIALDKANDGSWDHTGYVTDTSGVLKSYTPSGENYCIGYYNFKVAQHTSNYNAWASGTTNSWEAYTSARYGRIRG